MASIQTYLHTPTAIRLYFLLKKLHLAPCYEGSLAACIPPMYLLILIDYDMTGPILEIILLILVADITNAQKPYLYIQYIFPLRSVDIVHGSHMKKTNQKKKKKTEQKSADRPLKHIQ